MSKNVYMPQMGHCYSLLLICSLRTWQIFFSDAIVFLSTDNTKHFSTWKTIVAQSHKILKENLLFFNAIFYIFMHLIQFPMQISYSDKTSFRQLFMFILCQMWNPRKERKNSATFFMFIELTCQSLVLVVGVSVALIFREI